MFEAVFEGERVKADLALFDDGLVVFEDEFDGVLECNNVFFEVGVDMLDHRGQGGGLAAARRAGQEHNTARRFGDSLQNLE